LAKLGLFWEVQGDWGLIVEQLTDGSSEFQAYVVRARDQRSMSSAIVFKKTVIILRRTTIFGLYTVIVAAPL
jgi:hypothetical protein